MPLSNYVCVLLKVSESFVCTTPAMKNQPFPASLDHSRKEARLIMDAFCGAWKVQLDKSTGVEEFGRLFGWTEEKAKQYSSLQYTVEYTDDGKRCVVDYGVQKLEFTFKLGEQFEYTGIDGLKAKCTPALDGNKLIENFETDSGLAWKTVREVNGSTMTAVSTELTKLYVVSCDELK
ncbi:Fatty acid-binding protein, brain [Bulinus truncatus]|nr:Fatty acid-binding protein, brain [Bulinus truncatus]